MKQETTTAVLETEAHPPFGPTPAQGTAAEAWTLIIRPQRHLLDLRLGELWQARDLVQLFVWRDHILVTGVRAQ